jgi:hypothetical protein
MNLLLAQNWHGRRALAMSPLETQTPGVMNGEALALGK